MSLTYAHEKLTSAVHILAIGPGDVRSRLWHAYLEFSPIRKDHLPVDLQSDYEWIIKQLTRYEPNEIERLRMGKGMVQATLSRIKNSTGARIAQRIAELSSKVERALSLENVNSGDAIPNSPR